MRGACMIRQHVFCWNEHSYDTAALTPAPSNALSKDRLEQAARLCYTQSALPVYFQYPLEGGVVVGRCGLTEQAGETCRLTHQLIAQDAQDAAALMRARPLDCDRFLSNLSALEGASAPLDPESLADGEALSAAFRTLDQTFGLRAEPLAALIAAARLIARGECRQALVLMDGEEALVTRAAQQLMELISRCLPLEEACALRWSSLPPGDRFAANCLCFAAKASYRLAPLERRVNLLLDLPQGVWHNLPRTLEEKELEAARTLLAHDLCWMERVFHQPGGAAAEPPADRLSVSLPPFEQGMSAWQYFSDWTEELLTRRSQLNNEAFAVFARGEWARLTDRLVEAADCLPTRQYLEEMQKIIHSLRRREYAAQLGMAAESLVDLVSLLLDSFSWEEISLSDPQDVQLLRTLSLYAHSLDEDSLAQVRTGRALTLFYGLLQREDQATLHALEAMEALCREDPAQFEQVQALLRAYVLAQCKKETLPLGRDDSFVIYSMLAYVRFVDGVPDLRRLSALEQLIRQNCGERAMRHYEARLDGQRRRMSRHSPRRTRKKAEAAVLFALLGLLALAGCAALLLSLLR